MLKIWVWSFPWSPSEPQEQPFGQTPAKGTGSSTGSSFSRTTRLFTLQHGLGLDHKISDNFPMQFLEFPPKHPEWQKIYLQVTVEKSQRQILIPSSGQPERGEGRTGYAGAHLEDASFHSAPVRCLDLAHQ